MHPHRKPCTLSAGGINTHLCSQGTSLGLMMDCQKLVQLPSSSGILLPPSCLPLLWCNLAALTCPCNKDVPLWGFCKKGRKTSNSELSLAKEEGKITFSNAWKLVLSLQKHLCFSKELPQIHPCSDHGVQFPGCRDLRSSPEVTLQVCVMLRSCQYLKQQMGENSLRMSGVFLKTSN